MAPQLTGIKACFARVLSVVNGAGDKFFTGARVTVNENGGIGCCRLDYLVVDTLHGGTFTNDIAEPVAVFNRCFEPGSFKTEFVSLPLHGHLFEPGFGYIPDSDQYRCFSLPLDTNKVAFNPDFSVIGGNTLSLQDLLFLMAM